MLNSLSWGGAFPSFYLIRFVKPILRSMIVAAICLLFSMLGTGSNALATGTLAKAVPSQIESVRGQGFLIYGDFGDGPTGIIINFQRLKSMNLREGNAEAKGSA